LNSFRWRIFPAPVRKYQFAKSLLTARLHTVLALIPANHCHFRHPRRVILQQLLII
jgi:hypothetical protein